MRTVWNYDINGTVSPLLTVEEFNVITNNTYLNNPRVETALKAASQVVRNYCGWHICPALKCIAEPAGDGAIKHLPAIYVSEILKIREDGAELEPDSYEWRKNGLVKSNKWTKAWNAIEVVYMAGYDIEAVPDLAEAVAAITSGVLSVSAGVVSESADGVSISYSASASSIAAALTNQQKEALEPYKVVVSHAT